MLFTTSGQWAVFLSMVYTGLGVGFLYNLASAARMLGHGQLWSAVCDLLFCLAAFALTGGVCLAVNHGQMRLYMFAAVFAGFTIWQVTVGHLLAKLGKTLLRGFLAVARRAKNSKFGKLFMK